MDASWSIILTSISNENFAEIGVNIPSEGDIGDFLVGIATTHI